MVKNATKLLGFYPLRSERMRPLDVQFVHDNTNGTLFSPLDLLKSHQCLCCQTHDNSRQNNDNEIARIFAVGIFFRIEIWSRVLQSACTPASA